MMSDTPNSGTEELMIDLAALRAQVE